MQGLGHSPTNNTCFALYMGVEMLMAEKQRWYIFTSGEISEYEAERNVK